VNLPGRQGTRIGPDWQDRWMMDLTELTMPQVMERYCWPRAVDSHPAINIKHLITNLLSIKEPELPKLQRLGTHPVLMGPMKANPGQPPTLETLPDRF